MIDEIQKRFKDYQPQVLGSKHHYAVFLPLVEMNGKWHVLYQVRSETVSQPGEVSFPGGRVEENETFSQAAIREVVEELGVREEQVELWGENDYLVFSQGMIRCFVGRLALADLADLSPNSEVARVFTLPLASLLAVEPTYYLLESKVLPESDFPFERLRGGKDYPFSHHKRLVPFYESFSESIWGMTAQFTHRFVQLIRQEEQ